MSGRIPHDEMVEELGKLVWSKQTWLDDFSTGKAKRPDHDIDARRRELVVLKQARADYEIAAKRSKA
jgi:hypothetical protein